MADDAFTLADCAAAPALHYAEILHPPDPDRQPALATYRDRLLAAQPRIAVTFDSGIQTELAGRRAASRRSEVAV